MLWLGGCLPPLRAAFANQNTRHDADDPELC